MKIEKVIKSHELIRIIASKSSYQHAKTKDDRYGEVCKKARLLKSKLEEMNCTDNELRDTIEKIHELYLEFRLVHADYIPKRNYEDVEE